MAESFVVIGSEWVLLREIATGAGADSTFLTVSNFLDTLTAAQGNAGHSWPGSVILPEGASGMEHVALLIDTNGAPVSPTGSYGWRYAERWVDSVSNDAGSQERTAVGATKVGTMGEIGESVSDSKGASQQRRASIQITTDFSGLPGGTETHVQIWVRAR